MNFQKLSIFTGPGVYVFYRDTEILYIGATVRGLSRCLSPAHTMGKHFSDETIELLFIPAETKSEAFELETELIECCQPEFNGTHNDKHARYRMKRREELKAAASDGNYRPRGTAYNGMRSVCWKPSGPLISMMNIDGRELKVLKKFHLPDIKKDWPDAVIIEHKGVPIIYCGQRLGEKLYYNRKRDVLVLSKDEALLLD
jgi:hypothetical protein